jgi:hypothetical protein
MLCVRPQLTAWFFRSFDKVLRLPSSYWQELAELWGCHTESFAAAPNKVCVSCGDRFCGDPSCFLTLLKEIEVKPR